MNLTKAIACCTLFFSLIANAAEIADYSERITSKDQQPIRLAHMTIHFPNGSVFTISEDIKDNETVVSGLMRNRAGKILVEKDLAFEPLVRFPADEKKSKIKKEEELYTVRESDEYVVLGTKQDLILVEQSGRITRIFVGGDNLQQESVRNITNFQVRDKGSKVKGFKFKMNEAGRAINLGTEAGNIFDPNATIGALPAIDSSMALTVIPTEVHFKFNNKDDAKIIIGKSEQKIGAQLLMNGKTTVITKDRVVQYTVNGEGRAVQELSSINTEAKAAVLVTEKEIFLVSNKGHIKKLDIDFSRLQKSEVNINGVKEKLIGLQQPLIENEGKTFIALAFPYSTSNRTDMATGETFIMDIDSGELVKVAYSAMGISGPMFEVHDGILSLNGIVRKIDLRNLRAEANFFKARVAAKIVDKDGKVYDPIAATEEIFRNITEDFRTGRKKSFTQAEDTKPIFDNMVAILGQQQNPNPIITAEGGTGKTELAHSFFDQIAQGKIPSIPRTVRVYELQKSTLEQGSTHTGVVEGRLKALEASALVVPVIIFADEIHNLRGSATHEGNPDNDAINQLKPGLVDGLYHMVGTSTEDEFNPAFGGDSTLMRRFTLVKKPAVPKLEVLKIIDTWCEKFNLPKLSAETKDYLYEQSNRYIADGAQPSKATKLMDKAYSRKKNLRGSDDALTKEDINEAIIASGVSAKLFVASSTKQALDELAKTWNEKMAGQELARDAYLELEALRLGGFLNPEKPASLLVTGPKGAGKTRGAQTYAAATNRYFVKIDMSQYGEGGVTKFEQRLSQELFKDRFAVILFDEIEKAHPLVKNILLAILQDGKIKIPAKLTASDSKSNSVQTLDFTQSTVVCTTNAGEDYVLKHMKTGERQQLGFSNGNKNIDSKKLTSKIQQSVFMEDGLKKAAVNDGLSAFLLDRFTLIVPAFPPEQMAFRRAIDINLNQMLADYEKQKSYAFEIANRDVFLDFAVEAYFQEDMSNRIIETILHKHMRRWIARAVALAADLDQEKIVKKILIEFNPTSGESKVDVLTSCDGLLQ